jgi:RNA polymerase sigma factor (sigma-70 family)
MAANARRGPSDPVGERRLSVPEARFYAAVFSSARKGSLAELRRRGCNEEEAEEIFTAALERTMATVDPIARSFSEAQMVSYVKRACWTHLLAERQRRGLRIEIDLTSIRPLVDTSSPCPEEVAENREAAAIGREALQMLPERDRLVFRQRHQMNLSPEEILRNTPGISPRTYRKIIQRANARVLEAYERIRDGERCEEMRASLLRRYVAEESPEGERDAVEAHLAHCRTCQQSQARMRGYLADVAGALLSASSLAAPSHGARERAREALLRLAALLPGQGGDAVAGQMLGTSAVKLASACAGVAAGACLATGIVPGVGGVGLLEHQGHAEKHPVRGASRLLTPPQRSTLIDRLPTEDAAVAAGNQRRGRSGSEQAHEPSRHVPNPSTSPGQPAPATSYSASEARVSGRQTGAEMGAESGGQPLSPSQASPSTASSRESNSGSPAGNDSSAADVTSSEFGM